MQIIFNHFDSNKSVSYKDVIEFLKNNIELTKINADYERNEGYLRSIKEELNE